MDSLEEIEIARGFSFPKIYKDFYKNCESSIPKAMIGSDLFNTYKELNEWARD